MMRKLLICLALLLPLAQAYADRAAAVSAYKMGMQKMKLKDYRGASVEFSAALAEDPSYDPAVLQSANCYFYQGEKEKARSAYTDYLVLKPGDTKVQAFVQSLDAADQQGAVEIYGKGAQKCYDAGMGFMKAKDYKRAIQCFAEGLGYDANMYRAHLELGNAYYYSGDKVRALKAYEAYLKLKPNDAKVQGYVKALRKTKK